MEGETEGGDEVLRKLKPKLIDILSAEPDFVLQQTEPLDVLTRTEYKDVKSITKPSHKVRDLLDYVIEKGSSESYRLLRLLQEKEMQKTFPRLELLQINSTAEKRGTKTQQPISTEERPSKQLCTNTVVTEKQLMQVARKMGRSWKQFGREALGIETVKLEQIVEDNPHNMVEQVFAMLRVWSMRERSKATAKRLHGLLSDGDWALPDESIKFLLDDT